MRTVIISFIILFIVIVLIEYTVFDREPNNFCIFVFIGLNSIYIIEKLNDILNTIKREKITDSERREV